MANYEEVKAFSSETNHDDLTNVEFSSADVAFLKSFLEKSSEESESESSRGEMQFQAFHDFSSLDMDLVESWNTSPESSSFGWIDSEMECLSCSYSSDGMIEDYGFMYHFAEGLHDVIEYEGVGHFSLDCYEDTLEENNVYSTNLWS